MDQEALARRREVANRIRVKASPVRMSQEDFAKTFLDESVVLNRDVVERTTQVMFCDACAADAGNGAQLLRQLHVTIEDDPLRNYWKLATVKCFGCGFEECISLDKPDFSSQPMSSSLVDVWEKEREAFYEEMKRKQQAQQAAAIQARNQALQQMQHDAMKNMLVSPELMIGQGAQKTAYETMVRQREAQMRMEHIQRQEQEVMKNLEQKLGKQGLTDMLKDFFKS